MSFETLDPSLLFRSRWIVGIRADPGRFPTERICSACGESIPVDSSTGGLIRHTYPDRICPGSVPDGD